MIGGVMGLLLLGMRVGLVESGMFKNQKSDDISRGNIFMLFSDGKRFKKYLSCILIGIPLWFVVGVLVTFDTFSALFICPLFSHFCKFYFTRKC